MGLKILDNITVGNTGLLLSNLILTIKGNFTIRKKIIPSEELQPDNTFLKTIFEIYTVIHYLVEQNKNSIFTEDITLIFDTVDDVNLFEEIYNRLKARYVNCIDV